MVFSEFFTERTTYKKGNLLIIFMALNLYNKYHGTYPGKIKEKAK